ENINGTLADIATTCMVDAGKIASDCGSAKAVNVVLLGVLASRLDFEKGLWLEVIEETVPPKTVEINMEAFKRGYEVTSKREM
ncbi:MAG: indolepyruvate ferredoxin oxidoreductase, beta subunit, partial [Thermoanaerobacteraceae bacterium]|nr:indolepyruvate ferredoxin oxidoreductase, beta subunit [Thermoanaerobacteraceae bacterium]